jgi:hypothetical protein
MRTGLSAALVNTGTIIAGFGFVIAILGLLGSRYGAPIHKQPTLAAFGLIVGGLMLAGGYFMGRSRDREAQSTR